MPQQNGVVERKHRYLVEMALTLMSRAALLIKFWPFAFATAVFTVNCLPSPNLQNKSPFELLFHKPLDYNFFKTFGCACYPPLKPFTSHKLEPRTTQCVFLGYPLDYKGYFCYNMSTRRLYITRHAIFDEKLFLFAIS